MVNIFQTFVAFLVTSTFILLLNLFYSRFQYAHEQALQDLFKPLEALYLMQADALDLELKVITIDDLDSYKPILGSKVVEQFQKGNKNNETLQIYSFQQCLLSDSLKLLHPDTQVEDFYMYRSTGFGDSIRQAILAEYFHSQPHHEINRYEIMTNVTGLPSNYTSIYIDLAIFNQTNQLNKFCLMTKYMHLNTPQILYNKIDIARNQINYLKKLQDQGASNECLMNAHFQQTSYLLAEQQSCLEFFELIKMPEFSKAKTLFFAIKSNQHNATGIRFADNNVLAQFNDTYNQGLNCGQITKNIIAQTFMSKPALIYGRKFDLRIYLMIVSTNPVIGYFYGKAYINKCGLKNVAKNFNLHSHICNTVFLRRTLSNLRDQNRLSELQNYLSLEQAAEMWPFWKLYNQLVKAGYKLNQDWVKTHMIPQLKSKFAHFFLSSDYNNTFVNDPRIGEYTACDFNLDSNMQFWLLECTQNANMRVLVYPAMVEPIKQMHQDSLTILKKYTAAKFLRIKNLIHETIIPFLNLNSQEKTKKINQFKILIQEGLRQEIITNIQTNFHYINITEAQNVCHTNENN